MIFLDRIDELSIAVFAKGSHQSNDFPEWHTIVTLRNLWEMTEWNYECFAEDCVEYHKSGNFKREQSNLVRGKAGVYEILRKLHSRPVMQFGIRNNARVVLQINLFNLIEGILIRFYKETTKRGNEMFPIKFQSNDLALNERYEETKLLRLYRNKLAAHTSFQDPKNDSGILQWSSLLHLQGVELFTEDNPATFYVGGSEQLDMTQVPVYQATNNDTDFHLNEKYVLRDEFKKMKEHLKKWEEMLIEQNKHFYEQCPLRTETFKALQWSEIGSMEDIDK